MQIQPDILNRPGPRPVAVETTALGAVMLASLAVGFWNDTVKLAGSRQKERGFNPQVGKGWQEALLEQWRQALGKT